MKIRRVKFKVWDEKYKCWVKNSFLLYPEDEIKIQGRILTQFTGLKDKNNKEIYEGDILRLENDKNYRVFFDHGCFMVLFDNQSELPLLVYVEEKRCEISGNIFENPELLNENI